jgi:TRAP-type uncharacterized transport system fused permease subunit
VEFYPIQNRVLFPTNLDVIAGIIAIILAFVSGTLAFGITLPIVVCAMIAYAIFGPYLPHPLETPDLLIKDQLIPYSVLPLEPDGNLWRGCIHFHQTTYFS